ncbi:PP28 domain-containing protein [Fusarium falciforme]|uniref:PP28 domain-containing protein n=1 Tax=Fusarium falciforme TaxID=195108 RepID=UPI002300A4B7|nr:PP28 domain-containing protein [Fusarium falciforme]WAO87855.1 PP28 domain-containing protein [Fusarium falciforme]
MAGGPGTSSRGRGGKFRKPARGGGKKFSRDIRPVDADGNEISMWSVDAKRKDDDDDDDDDSEDDETTEDETTEEEDSDDDDDAPGPSAAPAQELSREDRKAEKKARKEAAIAKQRAKTVEVGDMPSSDDDDDDDSEEDSEDDDDMPANPNHSKKARNQTKAGVEEITEGVSNMAAPSRREREALEAAAAKERHMRLTAQGKTDEAKADLARLKAIREQRALDAARRQAEREEKEALEKAKKAEFEAKEARRKETAAKKGKKK